MPRPRKKRRLCFHPKVTYYKPQGVPLRQLQEIILTAEELEALKIKDCDKMDQHSAAEQMGVSQSTFQRILSGAREKTTRALVEGKALRIETG
jgi:predicted DNA-binding protein (UPF0251 family)